MGLRTAPAFLPAVGILSGTFLALRFPYLPVAGLAMLVALGFAGRGRWCQLVGWLALGMVNAAVAWVLPQRAMGPWDLERPVEVVARIAAPWQRSQAGWSVAARTVRIRQGLRVGRFPEALFLHLPASEEPPGAACLRLQGYLSRAAGFRNGLQARPGPWRLRVKSLRLVGVEGPARGGTFQRQLRSRLEAALGGTPAGSPGAALVRALVLGDRSRLPDDWRRGLRRLGLSHLLAVSGLHVGLVVGLVWLLSWRLPRLARLAMAVTAIAIYLLLVGPRPSLLRASFMAITLLAAHFLERRPHSVNALCLAAGLLVLVTPELVVDVGFQLTVAASAGILVVAPVLARRWEGLGPRLARPLAVSVAAQLCALPWALPRFHLLVPAGPLLNLAAVPWTAAGLALSLAWSVVALAAPVLARLLLPALDLWARPFSWPAAVPPFPWLSWPLALTWGESLLLAAALGLGLVWPRRGLLVLAGVGAVGWGLCTLPRVSPELVMLDVGQGDAVLLRDGPAAVLVDGGGSRGYDFGSSVLVPALARQGIRRLDAVLMTHPDLDHCGGLVDLTAVLPVGELWVAPGWGGHRCADALLRRGGLGLRVLWQGQERRVGRWRLETLHPPPGERRGLNQRSLVVRATVARWCVLLTGDVDATTERRLVHTVPEKLTCDILKVAHHGSRTSTSPALLDVARPRLALVSAGRRNPYGHPSPVILERLARRGITTLRSDRHGMVRLRLMPGRQLRISFGATAPGGE